MVSFLVYSNIWVSLGAASIASLFFAYHQVKPDFFWLTYIFSNTFLAYNLQRIMKNEWPKESSHFIWIQKNTNLIYGLMFFSALFSLYFTVQLQISSWILIAASGLVSLFYSGNWGRLDFNLRKIPFIKIYLIAFSWATMTVLLPWSEMGFKQTVDHLLLYTTVVFIVTGATIPFDIRDLKFDQVKQKTIPQILGVENAKFLAISLVVLGVVMFTFLSQTFHLYIFYLSALVLVLLIYFSNSERKSTYFSLGVEGALILLGASLWTGYW